MQRVALLAILSWPALGCSSSPTSFSGPDGSSSTADFDSSVTGGGQVGDGGAGGDGEANSGPPITCDSGGPLALKTTWPLPAVDTTEGIAITVDSQGNVYVTGTFNGSVKFGSTTLTAPTAPGTNNMFLAKYDRSGNVVLAKSWGTTTGLYLPPAIAVDSSGNVFLGGMFANTLDFGGSSTALKAVSYGDGFTVKVSPAGDALWAVRFGYNAGAAILSMTIAADGNPIVAGSADGDIILGSTTYPAAANTTQQPFIAKLSTTTGAVLWGNASGGNIKSGDDIFVSTDSAGRVFVAARVDYGGGAWSGDGADGGNFSALRAGFQADGSIMWGQVDYGAFPRAAAVDHAGRFWVLEDAYDTLTLSGTSTTFGGAQSGDHSVSMLFSPTDGTLLSGLDIGDTFSNAGAVDGHGNSLVTGTYWPSLTSPRPVGGLSLPAGSQAVQPFFLASLDGLSRAVSVLTLPTTGVDQPYAMTMDPGSGNVFVLASMGSGSTSDAGTWQPSLVMAVFGPDPCNDGAGPSGPSTGSPGNHGVLSRDGGSPYLAPDAVAPAACPASTAGAVNGAACPVAMGCSYGATCCICAPTVCNGQPTLWTCSAIQNDPACPTSPPTPATACPSTTLKCNYCEPGGRLYANCNAGGWSTGYAQILCQ